MLDQTITYTTILLIVIVAGRYRPRILRFHIPRFRHIRRVGVGMGRLGRLSLNQSAKTIRRILVLRVHAKDIVMFGPRLAIVPTQQLWRLLGYHRGGTKRRDKHVQTLYPCSHTQNLLKYNSTVTLYRKMPLKAISRLWGKVNQLDLPLWLRKPVLQMYIWMFDCNLEEAAIEDLAHYKNLGEFFRRQLKPHVRPVDQDHSVTSPADGKVLHFGKVENGKLEQVKGVTYSLRGFLGPSTWLKGRRASDVDDQGPLTDRDYHGQLKVKAGHSLHHCVIYLAPGDYHRFHSPVEWTMSFRRHFPGELLSVNPGVARWVQGLFNFNERAVYFGQWEHGFFSMTAVGATNVGSIKIYSDKELLTNTGKKHAHGIFYDKQFSKKGITVNRGEMFGEFNLGSTIVLIFEAPDTFDFKMKAGQKIRYGEPLGTDVTDS